MAHGLPLMRNQQWRPSGMTSHPRLAPDTVENSSKLEVSADGTTQDYVGVLVAAIHTKCNAYDAAVTHD